MKVSIFKDIRATSAPYYRDVKYALDRIKNGSSRELVDQIRFEVDKDKQNLLKQNLPCICFSGIFKNRAISGLTKHSGLICLDFDGFSSEEELLSARDTLIGDEYVFALFRSPSYSGLKVLIKVPPNAEMHKSYFDALAIYYSAIPGFDNVTSDVSRVCYESFDPDLYHNPESQLWLEGEEVDLADLGTETPVLPLQSENRIVDNLLKWWERKYGKRKGERNVNTYKLAIALHDFGISKVESYNILKALAETGFTEKEIHGIVKSAYKNQATFGTRFFEDFYKRRNIEKEVVNGKSIKQIQKLFPEVKEIEKVTESIRDTIVIDDFWTYDDKGKIDLVPHKFKKYLQSNFIFKYYPNKEAGPVFVQIRENKVRVITRQQIKDLVLRDLEQRPMIGMIPYDHMSKNVKYFADDFLSLLDTIEIDIKKDTEEEGYLYYQDCVVKVTVDNEETIDYIDLKGYVWENQIIDRSYKKADGDKAIYKQFIWLVSAKDEFKYDSIRSTIGYLLHSYKHRGNNRAIILNDEVISENPNGGSGKGIYTQAIGKMKRTSVIDGKLFDPNKSFQLQTVSIDTQVLAYDDVKKNFPFESIFSVITEGITYERKNKDAIKLSVHDSPKVLISTNYTIGGNGGSFDRRKFEVEFSSYFGAHHTPAQEFGHQLIDDWGEGEMNLFDNFMIGCLQLYLKKGLIKCPQDNLKTRKFIKDTCFEFYEWTQDGSVGKNITLDRKELLSSFLEEYKEQEKYLTPKRFALWIEAYAVFLGGEYKSGKSNGKRWAMIKTDPNVEIDPFTTPGDEILVPF